MPKKKEDEPAIDPFMGGEDDDLSDMKYVHDEDSQRIVDTHAPETKEEADAISEQEDAEKAADEVAEEVEAELEAEKKDDDDETKVEEKEKAVAEEEAVLDDDKDGIKVPKDRFDEVNDRMKTAEGEVASLKKQLETVIEDKTPEPEPDPYDYAANDKAAMSAMLEGDEETYSRLQKEGREALREETLREAKKLAAQGDDNLKDTLTFEEAGAAIEADYPGFVKGKEGYNDDAYEEMMDLYVGFAKSGRYSRVQALQKAAASAARNHDLTAISAEVSDEAPDNVVDIKKTNVKDKAKVANKQPPVMEEKARGGSEEPKLDIASMSEEEFEAMPESTKRRARGDFL
jgi:hypothetical protein